MVPERAPALGREVHGFTAALTKVEMLTKCRLLLLPQMIIPARVDSLPCGESHWKKTGDPLKPLCERGHVEPSSSMQWSKGLGLRCPMNSAGCASIVSVLQWSSG